jgi:hypothetical protein
VSVVKDSRHGLVDVVEERCHVEGT